MLWFTRKLLVINMTKTVLKIEHLNKSFGYRKIINDLSFDINEGEICGFLGPNGSGKTTTIKMISGLLIPDSGSISICGYNVEKDFENAMSNVGGIVENPDMYKFLSGRENLVMAARIHGNVSNERIEEVINIVGLQNRIDDKVKRYSLGMKQRLGIAQAILHKPRLLVFDEPTNGLDPAGIKGFREIIKRLASEDGTAILVSSHMMSEMEQMCNKVAIIEKGKLLEIRDMRDAAKNGENTYFEFVISNADKASEIALGMLGVELNVKEEVSIGILSAVKCVLKIKNEDIPNFTKALVENNVSVFGVQPVEYKLEDVYIDITGGGSIE